MLQADKVKKRPREQFKKPEDSTSQHGVYKSSQDEAEIDTR